ncbi:MAG TPA: MFS transporter [Pseudomonas sp.]|uniref:MFS transporter n=1 Tax=Pseudomonas sp. TaxID=306 RepID=UPI002ED98EF1
MSHTESSISQRLDRLPLGKFHYRIIMMICAGLFLDSFELQMAGSVLGGLLAEKWSTPQLNAWFISATFLGFLVGAWFSGVLGDKLGRRYCYQINLGIFAITSILAAFAPNMYVLIGLRFLMGIGLGGELVLGYATLSEFMPPNKRGRLVAFLSFVAQCALFVSSTMALWVIPNLGWRWMFGIAGVAALIIWYMRKSMPESPRWLASKGRLEEASAIVDAAERHVDVRNYAELVSDKIEAPEDPGKLSDLFKKGQVSKIVVGITIMVTIQICMFGLIGWLPSFFVQQGLDIVKSLQWNMVMTFGGPAGALISLLLVDRIGRKPIIVGSAVLSAMFALIYVNQTNETAMMISGFLMIMTFYGIVVVGQAVYLSELFPTRLRMRGTGVCSAVARLVAAAIPFAVPALFNAGGIRLVIAIVGVVLAVCAVIIMALGKETRKKSLEQTSL